MDIVYDHIQEEILSSKSNNNNNGENNNDDSATEDQEHNNFDLSTEFQETFRAFSNSAWGVKIGGLWDNVRKQGESYYEGARQEYAAASEEAVKGFSDLRNSIVGRTRGLSLGGAFSGSIVAGEGENNEKRDDDADTVTGGEKSAKTDTADGEGFISRFRAEAAKRLKEIEKAEDAADEALLRFGTNIRNFLRDAVSIAPPEEGSKVLFESKDADGKRVYHATRFEAQLHVIHTNFESFTKDPVSDQWASFKESFKVEPKTEDIAKDLDRYPDLRQTMETLVPEKVEYADFWARYYFLRLVVETEDQKRKELLKGASATNDEEVAWDEESDSESPSTPHVTTTNNSDDSSKSISKLDAPRRSNDQQSQPDSESSYDLVSGATSRAPGSPHEKSPTSNPKADESDEDWE